MNERYPRSRHEFRKLVELRIRANPIGVVCAESGRDVEDEADLKVSSLAFLLQM